MTNPKLTYLFTPETSSNDVNTMFGESERTSPGESWNPSSFIISYPNLLWSSKGRRLWWMKKLDAVDEVKDEIWRRCRRRGKPATAKFTVDGTSSPSAFLLWVVLCYPSSRHAISQSFRIRAPFLSCWPSYGSCVVRLLGRHLLSDRKEAHARHSTS